MHIPKMSYSIHLHVFNNSVTIVDNDTRICNISSHGHPYGTGIIF
jgi:hypothetical protein